MQKKTIIAGFVAGALFMIAGLSINVSDSWAKTERPFSGLDLTDEKKTPFEINTTIMEILPGAPSKIVAGEIFITITKYENNGEIKSPLIVDDDGDPMEYEDLRVGQRVVVRGLQLADGTVYATGVWVQPDED